jgi:hypothetical protein
LRASDIIIGKCMLDEFRMREGEPLQELRGNSNPKTQADRLTVCLHLSPNLSHHTVVLHVMIRTPTTK